MRPARSGNKKGELSKLTSETLLDAAGTYVDLLAVHTSELVFGVREKRGRGGASRPLAQTLAKIDPGLRVEVVRITLGNPGPKVMTRKLSEGGSNAAAKLVYLLGLDPATVLLPLDKRLVAIELVDLSQSPDALAAQALASGPGVRELAGLLALVEDARAKSSGPGRFIPTLEVSMAEGAFGAGPGPQSFWDNRWDMGLYVKWNLTEAVTGVCELPLAGRGAERSKPASVTRICAAKLILGVREAREACLSGLDQMRLAEEQIQQAEEAYKLSNTRLTENIKASLSERSPPTYSRTAVRCPVYLLQVVRDFDKAQLRLFFLRGPRR